MLAHAEPILCLSKFGLSKPLPKNKADTVKFRRPIPFTVSTTQLTEGVTPTPKQMSYEDVTVQLGQYGDVVEITDRVHDLAEDPVLMEASELAGEQAAETIEMVTYGVIKAGTTVFYGASGDSARTDVDDPLTHDRQAAVTRYLDSMRAKPHTKMVGASVKVSTVPIEPAYIAFGHTDLEYDIRAMTNYTSTEKYANGKPLPYEVGKVTKVRYILTPLLVPFQAGGAAVGASGMIADDAVTVDVYPVIYAAKESYGLVPLKGAGAISPSVLNPGTPSKSDPLGQRGYVGWKTWFSCIVLNDTWLARLEVGATDL
jgi:N4-gp56 family major capsid protein